MDIENIFTYHPVKGQEQSEAYSAVRCAGKLLATSILINVPQGADQTAAIRKVREAVMTANAGIALEGKL